MMIVSIIIVILTAVIGGIFLAKTKIKEKEYQDKIATAQRYVEKKEYEKAEETYLEAIDIEPKKPQAYVELADVYVEQDEYDHALEIIEKAIENVAEKDLGEVEKKKEEIEQIINENEGIHLKNTENIEEDNYTSNNDDHDINISILKDDQEIYYFTVEYDYEVDVLDSFSFSWDSINNEITITSAQDSFIGATIEFKENSLLIKIILDSIVLNDELEKVNTLNENTLIIGTWEDTKEDGYLENFNGNTIFSEDGTITRTIHREKEIGTYKISQDGKTITATMTEHYFDYPCIERDLCGWTKTQNYSEILTFKFIDDDTLKVTSNLSSEDFLTEFHNDTEIYRIQ
ncbi:tetratricopeptide repeat protein [Erysipelatoclostridium sp. An173]|uniref:tetratricopeptide repeat protein n=1 Tax=Erysipelatoclostridium sp. An173 TaxID=1965571 RepID=UPI0031BB2711